MTFQAQKVFGTFEKRAPTIAGPGVPEVFLRACGVLESHERHSARKTAQENPLAPRVLAELYITLHDSNKVHVIKCDVQ